MTLSNLLTKKAKRSIQRDIDLIFTVKGIFVPQTMEEWKELGFFSPTIKIRDRDIHLSKAGQESLRRICDYVYDTGNFKHSLNYDDIYKVVIDEISFWATEGLIPEGNEFIGPLNEHLEKTVKEYTYVCRIDGIFLEDINELKIGNKIIRKFSYDHIPNLTDVNEFAKESLKKEYEGSLIISGTESGSKDVSEEKFYSNSELALSILRLYSCALYSQAIRVTSIRLINDCSQAYGPASSFSWGKKDEEISFHKYFISTQDLKINQEHYAYWKEDFHFNELSSLLCKESKSELEEALIRSIYWLGEAQKDRSNASSWVKLWSCLECFFSLGEDEITESNARGISALILYGKYTHKKYRSYNELKAKVKKFYSYRSKVVHRAEYSHINFRNLEELSYIVAWVIITMASLMVRGVDSLHEVRARAAELDKGLIHK